MSTSGYRFTPLSCCVSTYFDTVYIWEIGTAIGLQLLTNYSLNSTTRARGSSTNGGRCAPPSRLAGVHSGAGPWRGGDCGPVPPFWCCGGLVGPALRRRGSLGFCGGASW